MNFKPLIVFADKRSQVYSRASFIDQVSSMRTPWLSKSKEQYVSREKGEKSEGRVLIWRIEEEDIPKGVDMAEFEVVFDPLGDNSILRPDAAGLKITAKKGESHVKKG